MERLEQAIFTKECLSKKYGAPVKEEGRCLLYRSESYFGKVNAKVEFILAIIRIDGIVVVGEYSRKKDALEWFEIYKK